MEGEAEWGHPWPWRRIWAVAVAVVGGPWPPEFLLVAAVAAAGVPSLPGSSCPGAAVAAVAARPEPVQATGDSVSHVSMRWLIPVALLSHCIVVYVSFCAY